MSLVMSKRPELFTAYLHVSSQWDGDLEALAESETPVYIFIGENDEYYGSEPSKQAYEKLTGIYRSKGFSEDEISRLVTLDVKPHSYFTECGINNEHGGGGLAAYDKAVMGWLFSN